MEIRIHFADENLIVCEKPAGLLSVKGVGAQNQDCLIARLLTKFEDALIVHRLDMQTSGLMVVARGVLVHKNLSNAFAAKQITKTYIARVHGDIVQSEGQINAPLIKDWPNRPKQMIDYDIGKPAQTIYKVLARELNETRVELSPITGRTHQLRVHMLHLGHPILGDRLYSPDDGHARLMLHANSLKFNHPINGNEISFTSMPDF